MSLLLLFVGLTIGNIVSVYLFGTSWTTMAERSFFQGIALGAAALVGAAHS